MKIKSSDKKMSVGFSDKKIRIGFSDKRVGFSSRHCLLLLIFCLD